MRKEQKQRLINWLTFVVRWSIAIIGIAYVVLQMSWNDRILGLLPGSQMPRWLVLAGTSKAQEEAISYTVINPDTGLLVDLPRSQTANEPDRANLTVTDQGRKQYVLGVDLMPDLKTVKRLLLADTPKGPVAHWAQIADVSGYRLTIPHPRVKIGVVRMVREARPTYLLLALAIFPGTILITCLRWQELLKALDIRIPILRTFELNMVGSFYNSFMPGSTGGDVLKAYYVAKQTHHRTRAVMSVLVDRIIGLLALIVVGGVMASMQWSNPKCRQVAIGSAALIGATVLGLIVFFVPVFRKYSGLGFFMSKLPMQRQVNKAIETMHIYGRRPLLVITAIVCSFPVHLIVIASAMFAGFAFGLPIPPFYYWMAVPVIVLAGALPISPQGAGVMEYFAVNLLSPQGATVAQAFALTMSIRLTQIIWNLTGGFFVLRGGYHAPSKTEQRQVEVEDVDKKEPLHTE